MAQPPRNDWESGQGLVSYAALPCLVLLVGLGLAAALGGFVAEQFHRPLYEGVGLALGVVGVALAVWRWVVMRKK